MDRRNFIKSTAAASTVALVSPDSLFDFSSKIDKVKVGIVGCGMRGQVHLDELLKRNDVEVVGIAEPDQRMIDRCNKIFAKHKKKPVE
ncbi:twin-arginine translocation signal domain-containing protein [Empedobacter falsenii]|uniref:twin-arginine translocation signal domain-containing protein n=1 Tax=Empedobacter falsenii TaxID=343874 RepID=UPI003A7FE395